MFWNLPNGIYNGIMEFTMELYCFKASFTSEPPIFYDLTGASISKKLPLQSFSRFLYLEIM